MRIYLIGFMGCGKTSLGKRLAKKLDYAFLDTDAEVEIRSGKSILQIFGEEGEERFRDIEREVLHETSAINNAVIATGGGTPIYFDNMEFMQRHGVTVYLQMSPLSLSYRLKYARKKRPLIGDIQGEELINVVTEKLNEREPVYMQSQCIIKGESAKPDRIVSLVFGA